MDRLNDLNASDVDDEADVRNVLHEIAGQIRGNEYLAEPLKELSKKVEAFADSKKLSEPYKWSLASELRERLRGFEMHNMKSLEKK